jgi:hypothetical protein
LAAASAQNIMNAATAVADALSGPLGWALLAGAAAALIAWGLSQEINQQEHSWEPEDKLLQNKPSREQDHTEANSD